jgi:hypothetical protein
MTIHLYAMGLIRDLIDVRLWPTAAISSAEIYTCRMAAFWTGAELSLVGLHMAACDPL